MTSIKDTIQFPYKTPSFTFYKSLLKYVERAHKLQPDADGYALVEAVVSMELIPDRWAARHYVAFYLWDGVDPKDVLDHASNLAYSPEEQRVRAEQELARAEARRKGRESQAAQATQRAQEALRLLEDGLSRPEVAQRLGMSEASLSKYLSRARQYVPDPLPSPSPDRSEAEFDEEAERILSLLA